VGGALAEEQQDRSHLKALDAAAAQLVVSSPVSVHM
jgi:hypothetical protein